MYYLLQPQPFARSVTRIPLILESNIHTTVLVVRLVKSVQLEHTLRKKFQVVRCQQRLAVGSVMQATFVQTLEAGRLYKTTAAVVFHFFAQQAASLQQLSVPTFTPSITPLPDLLVASQATKTIVSDSSLALPIAPALAAFCYPRWTLRPRAALLASTLR